MYVERYVDIHLKKRRRYTRKKILRYARKKIFRYTRKIYVDIYVKRYVNLCVNCSIGRIGRVSEAHLISLSPMKELLTRLCGTNRAFRT